MSIFKKINNLTLFHYNNCDLYKWYIDSIFPTFKKAKNLESIPWLPVRAFKNHELKSIPN